MIMIIHCRFLFLDVIYNRKVVCKEFRSVLLHGLETCILTKSAILESISNLI